MDRISQTQSTPEPKPASFVPSGLNAVASKKLSFVLRNRAISLPPATSQARMSQEPQTNTFPSGENASDVASPIALRLAGTNRGYLCAGAIGASKQRQSRIGADAVTRERSKYLMKIHLTFGQVKHPGERSRHKRSKKLLHQ